ncbi:hypothetical protein RHMOL_Rhmol09G0054300 [Rhododendron molle]|uniref:Uncharacterized protein n=1 Tax=Rhododendron molle TaxID=49168 RepID=A0ACC0MB69_RHOML|nr:hypothetical protein RHMOL_Rhmol09G0054300 [Rhododendron molle]
MNASGRYCDWIKQSTEHSRVWKKVDLAAEQRNSRSRNGLSGRGKDPAAEALISQGDFASNRLLSTRQVCLLFLIILTLTERNSVEQPILANELEGIDVIGVESKPSVGDELDAVLRYGWNPSHLPKMSWMPFLEIWEAQGRSLIEHAGSRFIRWRTRWAVEEPLLRRLEKSYGETNRFPQTAPADEADLGHLWRKGSSTVHLILQRMIWLPAELVVTFAELISWVELDVLMSCAHELTSPLGWISIASGAFWAYPYMTGLMSFGVSFLEQSVRGDLLGDFVGLPQRFFSKPLGLWFIDKILERIIVPMQRRTRARAKGGSEGQARADSEVAHALGPLLRTPQGAPPPYAAKNVISTVMLEDLARVRVKYSIFATVTIRRPREVERAHFPGPGETCLYITAFEGGLRLLFPTIVREVLCHLGLAPAQIVPNSWRHLIGCAALWAAMSNGETPLSKCGGCFRPGPLEPFAPPLLGRGKMTWLAGYLQTGGWCSSG